MPPAPSVRLRVGAVVAAAALRLSKQKLRQPQSLAAAAAVADPAARSSQGAADAGPGPDPAVLVRVAVFLPFERESPLRLPPEGREEVLARDLPRPRLDAHHRTGVGREGPRGEREGLDHDDDQRPKGADGHSASDFLVLRGG